MPYLNAMQLGGDCGRPVFCGKDVHYRVVCFALTCGKWYVLRLPHSFIPILYIVNKNLQNSSFSRHLPLEKLVVLKRTEILACLFISLTVQPGYLSLELHYPSHDLLLINVWIVTQVLLTYLCEPSILHLTENMAAKITCDLFLNIF